jgi:hypothetical protein
MPRLNALFAPPALAALALSLASAATVAQDNRWFRVELVVFAHQAAPAEPGGAASPEQWQAIPELDYPDEARFLIYPERVQANLREYPGTSVVDTYGRQIITLPEQGDSGRIVPPRPVIDPSAAATGDVPSPSAEGAAQGAAVQSPDAIATGAPANPAAPVPAALPVPFMVLPEGYQQLRAKVAQMQRSGRYDVLFHETWVQPVPSEASSLPIVLDDSGDTGRWPRLQGSIKLYLTRYLQVETDLWLNTTGSYLPGTWQMPAPPLSPPSLIIEEPLPAVVTPPADPAGAPVPGLPAPLDAAATPPAPQTGVAATAISQDALAEVIPDLDTRPVYPFRHAVALQQKARMRSNETHYIDHPLLGVVIRFTPATAEELAAIAAQQPDLPGIQAP